MSRRKPSLLAPLVLLFTLSLTACGGQPASLNASFQPNSPAVYRVSVTAESGFSGPVSDLEGATDLTAAFRVTPVSGNAVEVEAIYVAASVRDAYGEPVALGLGDLAGSRARIEFEPPGAVSRIEGDSRLLEAPIPLVSMREVLHALFPPLPADRVRKGDTWTGDTPFPFANFDDVSRTRMRYALDSVNARDGTGRVQGYELSTGGWSFSAATPGGRITGTGDLQINFDGELDAREGYARTERTAEFVTDIIRLPDTKSFANGDLRLRSSLTTERLSPAEQLGLDTD